MRPIYRVGGMLIMDPGVDDGVAACAALEGYGGSAEAYSTFITPEALTALQ